MRNILSSTPSFGRDDGQGELPAILAALLTLRAALTELDVPAPQRSHGRVAALGYHAQDRPPHIVLTGITQHGYNHARGQEDQ
jgi:hypothetical protein